MIVRTNGNRRLLLNRYHHFLKIDELGWCSTHYSAIFLLMAKAFTLIKFAISK